MRDIYIIGNIDKEMEKNTLSKILEFNDEDSKLTKENRKPINIYIDSCGGVASAAFSIVKVIEKCESPVNTYAIGDCMSAAFIIFISGKVRYVSEFSIFMRHRCSTTGVSGKAEEIKTYINACMDNFDNNAKRYIKKYTKLPERILNSNTEEFLTPQEAIKYKVADILI